jgi:capsular polysaccharide biosynthesis protein
MMSSRSILRKLLVRYWWLIAAFTLLFGLAGFLYSYLQPRVYKAQAVIAISYPRYLPNFDPRYQTINPSILGSRAILDISRSDQIQVQVFEEWQSPSKSLDDRRSFRNNALKASEGSDPTIIFLTVALDSAQEAARLANYWAELVVERANQLYSGQDQSQILFFEAQIESAGLLLEAAEGKLVEFEGRSEIEPLKTQYNELLLIQKEALRKQRLFKDALRDAEGLLEQASTLGRDQTIPSWLGLNFTLLQLRVYGDASASDLNTPASGSIQFQLGDSSSMQPVAASDFRAAVQNWVQSSTAQMQELEGVQVQTTAAVYDLQQRIQNLENEKSAFYSITSLPKIPTR